jgi:IS5 family transposase
MREVQVNLAYRWFIGYRLEETLPDHSTLSKALERFGDEVFDRLFSESIRRCQASGLISGKVLHVDVTTIRADLDANRVGRVESSDGDARFGHFPRGQVLPGYKQQTVVDEQAQVIVGLGVMPADRNDHEGVAAVIDRVVVQTGQVPEVVCADAAYGNGPTCGVMSERGIRLVSPPPQVHPSRPGIFTSEDFMYEPLTDSFCCPGNKTLRRLKTTTGRPNQICYRAQRRDCRGCPLKARCTSSSRKQLKVSLHHQALHRLRVDSRTASFRSLYRRRAPVVEGVFAEAKQWHGLRRAWRRGLAKMRMQCLLIAAVLNFKRLVAIIFGVLPLHIPRSIMYTLSVAFTRLLLEWQHKKSQYVTT